MAGVSFFVSGEENVPTYSVGARGSVVG
jgi:hypothetical protein